MMKNRMAKLRVGPWELEVSVLRATGLHEVGMAWTVSNQSVCDNPPEQGTYREDKDAS